MRIAAALPLYPPGSRVGAWLTTHEFLAAAACAGHQVDVVTTLGQPTHDYVLDGVNVHPHVDLAEFAAGADAIVSHLGDDQRASRLARQAGIPSVRMVHGLPGVDHKLDDDLVVFNSASLAAAVGWTGSQIVAHPPVAADDYRTTPGDRVTLVNLSTAKGGHLFWLLAQRMPDVQFLGVRGAYGKQVDGRLPNVEVIPSTLDMARDVYARTRILLMPSIQETWGRTAIEAACSGIPTVAAPTAGLMESLGEAGRFAPRNHPAEWDAAIRRLLEPEAWAAASVRASARAAQLDPAPDLARFVAAIEALVPARAAA